VFYVFSDDLEYVKRKYQGKEFVFVEGFSGDKSHYDMFLMSKCRHNIVANSSFSWWGAWLNTYTDKIILCPEKWSKKYNVYEINSNYISFNDNTVKAIYFREVPTLIFTTDIDTQVRKSGYVYMQIPDEIMDSFVISTQGKSAQDALDEFLFRHTFCTESVSISAIPIYHLEPNTRIYVSDENSKVDGEYIVSRISLPLTYNGTMNITATKAVEKIY
jgi:hypothetical protein